MPILSRATPIPKTHGEFYEFLNAHYSNLFGNRFPDASAPLGWHKVILFLCEQTQRLIRGYGVDSDFVFFDQIKEKFGGLRVYFTIEVDDLPENVVEGSSPPEVVEHFRDHIDNLIRVAERLADKTCSSCGEDTQPVNRSSYGVYCQNCWQLANSQRKKHFIP